MSEKRRMTLAVTLLITADLTTDDENNTEVVLANVGNTCMCSILPLAGAGETSPEFKQKVATMVTKAGVQFMLNDMAGEHATPPPKPNAPGADA